MQPAYMLSMLLNFQPLVFKIIRTRATLSLTALKTRGLGLMSSRANLTAAMMAAAITNVEAKRSRILSSFSRAMARRISPMISSIGEYKTKVVHR